ncbi:unnamed protein product [Cuscuta epithymum]|uniref:Myb/SANT-like domain-containing protein n=1 Tax=Cuscuta epithymum TaxID=186058 RepID=A0AAV0DFE0_9ASTE|nr:unnamed protein product [Cuscuta epithymum]CAH9098637.1 unnamed protein product [Cuscuta epithymum]
MEHAGESEKQKKSRISWKNINVVKTFLETCIHEISVNGREGSSLKALSWKKVADVLKGTHNFSVDRKQMKNHYDYLKGKYGAWLLLKNKTGNVYDPSTNTFNLTPEEWEIEIKKNKYIETLRTTSLPFPELCAQLFDGSVATGVDSWGPTSVEPIPHGHTSSDGPIVVEEEVEFQGAQAMSTSTGQCSSHKQSKKLKSKGKQANSAIDEEFLNVIRLVASKHGKPEAPSKPEPPTFDDCMNKLKMLGWEEDDPFYGVALAIFCDPNDLYREAWMKIDANLLPNWVKMIGKKLGFM